MLSIHMYGGELDYAAEVASEISLDNIIDFFHCVTIKNQLLHR